MDFYKALDVVNSNIKLLETSIEIDINQSLNYVISTDIVSEVNIPNYRTSMRDGYSILYDENISDYIIEGEIFAGEIITNSVKCNTEQYWGYFVDLDDF